MPEEHRVGKLGVNVVDRIVTAELEWVFREMLQTDVGIDAQIEVCESSRATGRLLAAQIKAGSSVFGEPVPSGWVFRPKKPEQMNYWLGYALPVLILLERYA